MKLSELTSIILLAFVAGCSGSDSSQIDSAQMATTTKQMTVDDIYAEIYDGKEISDPASKAWKILGSIGLPEAQEIKGSITKTGQVDSTVMINFLQHEADVFSWQSFISLTWPMDASGVVDSSTYKTIPGSSIWETWMPSHRIFKSDGSQPDPWPYNKVSDISSFRILGKINTSGDDINNLDRLSAEDAPLIDRNGNYVLYEVFFNKAAYDYVVDAGIYNISGQKKFVQDWPNVTTGLVVTTSNEDGSNDTLNIAKEYSRAYFPIGNIKDSTEVKNVQGKKTTYQFTTGEGAIIVKTAWSLMLESDDTTKYFTRKVDNKGTTETYGLVGMHVAHKVAEATQWVWSSFEHMGNAPSMVDGVVQFKRTDYRFFDLKRDKFELYNKPPAQKYQPDKSKRVPTQVVKMVRPIPSANMTNAFFHDLIKRSDDSSIWLNYRLVGTQWPFDPTLFTAGGLYQPQILGNPVLETYKQSESSCMGCHRQARFLYSDKAMTGGYSADFIYSLNSAK